MKPESAEAATTALDKAESASALQTPGSMLVHERTRRGLSIQQAAEGLHLDTWIVEAIEANHFLALGAPVYAKGYLRKYALLLELAPDVVVARYEALTDTLPEPTPVPVNTTAPPPRPQWPKYVGWSALAAAVLAVGFVVFEYVWPALEGLTITRTQAPVTASPARPASDEALPPTSAVEPPVESAAESTAPATTSAAEPDGTPAPAAGSGVDSVRVKLAFSASSWTEVYDVAGRRLFYGIAEAGDVHTLAGTPPLEVTVGVASAVAVQVNDRNVVVPRRANRDSARFVIAADGSVR
jgi:cytoskeleton protein RodZ